MPLHLFPFFGMVMVIELYQADCYSSSGRCGGERTRERPVGEALAGAGLLLSLPLTLAVTITGSLSSTPSQTSETLEQPGLSEAAVLCQICWDWLTAQRVGE